MTFANSTQNRTNLQNTIRSKQQLFNRFNRRCSATKSHNERTFIKNEMTRICKELTTCANQWKNCGFGTTGWITNNYNSKCMNCNTKTTNSTTTHRTRSNKTTKTSNRKTTRSRTSKRTPTTTSRKTNNTWSWGRSFSFSR